jgi:hypothetical protein
MERPEVVKVSEFRDYEEDKGYERGHGEVRGERL